MSSRQHLIVPLTLVTCLAFLAPLSPWVVAQDESKPATPVEDTDQVTFQLLRVRSDWSQGKDTEGIEPELKSLLKGEALPDDFRENLLGSMSQILFPEAFAATYRPEEFDSLLAWLEQYDLMRVEAEASCLPSLRRPDARSVDFYVGGYPDNGEIEAVVASVIPPRMAWQLEYHCGFLAGSEIIPIPPIGSSDKIPPFVTRTYKWRQWCIPVLTVDETTGPTAMTLKLDQGLQRHDIVESTGLDRSVEIRGQGNDGVSVELPLDRVAVIQLAAHTHYDEAFPKYVRQSGWDPILVVRPPSVAKSEATSPSLATPASLIVASSLYSPNGEKTPIPAEVGEVDDKKHVQSFDLQDIQMELAVGVLQDMLEGDVLFGYDHRGNSIVVTGTRAELDRAEEILQELRRPPTPLEPAAPATNRPGIDLDAIRQAFSAMEEEAQAVARASAAEKDATEAGNLRIRLARLVAESFDLRQKLQQAELGLLEERIRIIQSRLQQREAVREEIIGRRVDELLAGEPDKSDPYAAKTPRTPVGTPITPSLASPAPASPTPLPLRSPLDFHREVTELRDLIREDKESLRSWPDDPDWQSRREKREQQMANTQQELALLQQEYQTQLDLLDAEVEVLARISNAKERELKHVVELQKNGYVSSTGLEEANAEFEQAQMKTYRAIRLGKLYGEKSLRESILQPVESESDSRDKPRDPFGTKGPPKPITASDAPEPTTPPVQLMSPSGTPAQPVPADPSFRMQIGQTSLPMLRSPGEFRDAITEARKEVQGDQSDVAFLAQHFGPNHPRAASAQYYLDLSETALQRLCNELETQLKLLRLETESLSLDEKAMKHESEEVKQVNARMPGTISLAGVLASKAKHEQAINRLAQAQAVLDLCTEILEQAKSPLVPAPNALETRKTPKTPDNADEGGLLPKLESALAQPDAPEATAGNAPPAISD